MTSESVLPEVKSINEQSEVADVEQVAADNTRAQGQGPPTPVKSIFTSAVAKSR